MIATVQLAALIYGMNVVCQARPVFVVFSKDSFDLVTAGMLKNEDIAKAGYPDYRSLPLTGPVYVYTQTPADTRERNEVVLNALSGGTDLPQLPKYYMPYAEHMEAAGQAAKPIADLKKHNPDRLAEIDEAVRNSRRAEAELGYLPLRAKYQDQAVLVGKSDGKIQAVMRVSPWPASRQ